MHDDSKIRDLLSRWAAALHAKDLRGVMACYAPDALAFDLAPPLRHRRADIEQGLADWFRSWTSPIGYETRDVAVSVGADLAFAHGLSRFTGTRTDGTTTDVWFRTTVCFRRSDGAWTIAHEHTSVPFYMDGSFRAAVDLQP